MCLQTNQLMFIYNKLADDEHKMAWINGCHNEWVRLCRLILCTATHDHLTR